MNDPPIKPASERDYERQLREMNEALLVSSVRQHELAEQARKAEAALRQAKDLLAKSNEDLESRVAERTAELEQAHAALMKETVEQNKLGEQLRQSQKMESMGTLAAGIAHDFNNILNIIQGYTSVLRGGANSDQIAESVEAITETTQRAAALVQQLLTLARKTETKVEPVSPNSLIKGLSNLLKETFPKNIELTLDLAPSPPAIMADSNQITQVLLNLCLNARDAMPDGGTLALKTDVVDKKDVEEYGDLKPEEYVSIEVIDTGVGMDEDVQSKIFEPFFTTKEIGQGTGLGLAVVYGIVKSHNGFVQVESKPMRGATFRLYFPVVSSGGERVMNSIPEGSSSERQDPGHETILVVEDEPLMLRLLENVLSTHGYRVLAASDGEQAMEAYRCYKTTIGLVLLDVGLPKLTGWHVLLKLKEENPEVRVVIASGYLEPKMKAEMACAGVRHFVHKPYRLNEVLETIQGLVEKR